MTTDVENPIEEVETLPVENEESTEEFEIVSNSLRDTSRNHFLANELAEALMQDKTAKVPKDFQGHRLYRWAREHGYKLRSKGFAGTDYKIIWFEKIEKGE